MKITKKIKIIILAFLVSCAAFIAALAIYGELKVSKEKRDYTTIERLITKLHAKESFSYNDSIQYYTILKKYNKHASDSEQTNNNNLESLLLIIDINKDINNKKQIKLAIISTIIALMYLFIVYLLDIKPNISSDVSKSNSPNEKLQHQIIEVLEERYGKITRDQTSALQQLISDRANDILDTHVLGVVESKYKPEIIENKKYQRVTERLENLKADLREYIDGLTSRGNLNLIIGIIISLGAVAILGWTVLNSTLSGSKLNWESLIPRIALAILVQGFAFFFLRLYRSSLDELRYFRNELTNVNSRLVAFEAAWIREDWNRLDKILEELMTTERNFKLKKGETTSILELEKLLRAQDQSKSSDFDRLVRELAKELGKR